MYSEDIDIQGADASVLIVDDDPVVCEIYRVLLADAGYAVDSALSFDTAIQLMEATHFDVVITDVVLGEKNGLDVLAQCQEQQPDTPVILITGLPNVQTAAAAVRLNAYEYLAKPVTRETLLSTVARALQLKRVRDEKNRVEAVNQDYRRNLEQLVAARTQKLKESHQRYQLLFENSRDAIYMADWQGCFLAVNQAFVELLKVPKDVLMISRIGSFHADPSRREKLLAEIRRHGFVKDYAVRLKRPDGTIIECLLSAHLLTDGDGQVEGYTGICRDITAQKRADEKIRAQNRFLTNVIESLGHPFMVIDVADYSVKIANAAARQLLNNAGQTCYALNHGRETPCDPTAHRCPLHEVQQTRQPVHLTHIHKDVTGREAEHEVHAFPLLDVQGHVSQVIQYCIDISEKKRLESIAEAANLMDNLGYIFAGIRHEIGNPLNSVKMALAVLSKNLCHYPRDTIAEFVDRALGEVSRVEYLLKALKNFSLFETPEVAPLSLKAFMHDFKALAHKDFLAKGIRINLDLPEEEVHVLTDPRAFHQVMLNLITNAADALAGRPEPRIDIEVVDDGDVVQVHVLDNGHGIAEADLSNLFKPFFTTKPHGTGLGMVIIKKMLARMDSAIRIASTPNQGTVITMTLPTARQAAPADATPELVQHG